MAETNKRPGLQTSVYYTPQDLALFREVKGQLEALGLSESPNRMDMVRTGLQIYNGVLLAMADSSVAVVTVTPVGYQVQPLANSTYDDFTKDLTGKPFKQ